MRHRLLTTTVLFASAAIGVAAGALLAQVAGPDAAGEDVRSITGVGSGVGGTEAKRPEEEGVAPVVPPPDASSPTDPAAQEAATDSAQSQTVAIEGVEGAEGALADEPRENIVEIRTANDGLMQSIRGIKGIDTVMLQNLETVLRMQTPPEEGQGGNTQAAAALLTMENDEPPDPEDEPDGREELTEFELEGS